MLYINEIQVERDRQREGDRAKEIWCHVCIRVFVYVVEVEVDFDQRLLY